MSYVVHCTKNCLIASSRRPPCQMLFKYLALVLSTHGLSPQFIDHKTTDFAVRNMNEGLEDVFLHLV